MDTYNPFMNGRYRLILCQECGIAVEAPLYYLGHAFCSSECLREWLEEGKLSFYTRLDRYKLEAETLNSN